MPVHLFPLSVPGVVAAFSAGSLGLLAAEDIETLGGCWEQGRALPQGSVARQAELWLKENARAALFAREVRRRQSFSPECLTVYLSNHCNLGCSYCYAGLSRDGRGRAGPLLDENAFMAAATLVADNCAKAKKDFQLVAHGGGEPSVHWRLLQGMVENSRRLAAERGIGWRGHVATNGMLPKARARWLGENFDSIGLSCDGPPDIQNRQRPRRDGRPSAMILERTAEILRSVGADIEVRATITPATVHRQMEIVEYCRQKLGVKRIRFELQYGFPGNVSTVFDENLAAFFVEHFIAARKKAAVCDCTLSCSGVRLEEMHGPYCDLLRQVLHLTPDGAVTGCFFCVDGSHPEMADRIVGRYDSLSDAIRLDFPGIDRHRAAADAIPPACLSCPACFHCSRGCPNVCIIRPDREPLAFGPASDSFHCRVNRLLAEALIVEAGEGLLQEERRAAEGFRLPSEADRLKNILSELPAVIDGGPIIENWQRAVAGGYSVDKRRMPPPLWRRRGFSEDGSVAWRRIRQIIGDKVSPISVYLHIPFCDQRCDFCDCYSLFAPRGSRLHPRYLERLVDEIKAWSENVSLAGRPVTTVHLGGGTPGLLSPANLKTLCSELRAHLGITGRTEWAIEATTASLTDEHLDILRRLGFSRLHIGVQTLKEPLRQTIGRRSPAGMVMKRIEAALKAGFVTSVDLLYGLPGENVAGLFAGMDRLIDAGINGLSLYRFNRSSRNRRFVHEQGNPTADCLRDYAILGAAEQWLLSRGLHKNHFCHYAFPADENLYFTHAVRGEDLLALGASADGVFNGYHYRHSEVAPYLRGDRGNAAGLQGGVLENFWERRCRPLVNGLLAGHVCHRDVQNIEGQGYLARWQESGLLTPMEEGRALTASGSWFVNDMIEELLGDSDQQ